MCMCLFVHVHVHVHVPVCVFLCVYVHMCLCMCVPLCVCAGAVVYDCPRYVRVLCICHIYFCFCMQLRLGWFYCYTRCRRNALKRTGTIARVTETGTTGYLSFGPIAKYVMFFVTSARARRPGAASQAFERMHNTLSHRVKT
jgi:hypothetical protein